MAKLAKYLKSSAGLIVLIVCLLFLQAYCDLELPDYTSRIVNEGIQQKGIQDGVPEQMREETAENLKLFLDEEDQSLLDESYTLEDGTYVLNDLSREEREELGSTLEQAELVLSAIEQAGSGASKETQDTAAASMMAQLPEGVSALDAVKMLPQETRDQIAEAVSDKFGAMPDTMISQYTVAFVENEYEALGMDLGQMQIRYIMKTGGIGDDI